VREEAQQGVQQGRSRGCNRNDDRGRSGGCSLKGGVGLGPERAEPLDILTFSRTSPFPY